jgi:hypothetical protein
LPLLSKVFEKSPRRCSIEGTDEIDSVG